MPRQTESILAAIKNAVDIVSLVGEYLPLVRSGSKFKALCPFHDDHNPSLEINPERQSFKCWSCGAGGDVFDFYKEIERVEFPEALRMLAERAGIALETPSAEKAVASRGPSKSDLLAVNTWAERTFLEAQAQAPEVQAYVAGRGIDRASVERFRLGYAPDARDWLMGRARRAGHSVALLESAGLVVRPQDAPGLVRERFRGRLMFPIHDPRGRTMGFGGRVLPAVERVFADQGKHVAKYLNTAETPIFQKRRLLYGADLARAEARALGWVAVVEGYTDVIAAHQAGLTNVVGTLGTALGDDHVVGLRRLADRVVLVFDGDEAGQTAADRALELFLGHEVDVRVLTLPDQLDPCDFLRDRGVDAFRALLERARDPLAFAIDRAELQFDLDSPEGARQASEWVLAILARAPVTNRVGLDVKIAKALDMLAGRLRLPVATLDRRLTQVRREAAARTRKARDRVHSEEASSVGGAAPLPPVRVADLDNTDRQLLEIVLNEPSVVGQLISRVAVASLRDAPLRAILQACYDLYAVGQPSTFEWVALRLDDPGVRALAAELLLPIDKNPRFEGEYNPAPWEDRFAGVLTRLAERDRLDRLRDLKAALAETDETLDPDQFRALRLEYLRLKMMKQRPDTKRQSAS